MSTEATTEKKILETSTSIIEELKKINEVLKDSRIDDLCSELYAYARTLEAVVTSDTDILHLRFHYNLDGTYTVYLIVNEYYTGEVYVENTRSISDLFKTIFGSQELKESLVKKILGVLVEVSKEIASKADLVERVKRLEEVVERHLDP
jgi:hypothetical protein